MTAGRGCKILPVALAGILLLISRPEATRGDAGPSENIGARIDRLYEAAAGSTCVHEELEYAIEAGPLDLARGTVRWTCLREENSGRAVLRLRREISISNRRQESEALLDAAGLFPLEYTRSSTGPDGETHRDSVLWDHLGGRIFCEARTEREGRILQIRDRQERRLGIDLPVDILDPLSAIMVYRLRSAGTGKADSWTVSVIEGCDEIFAAAFTPRDLRSFAEDQTRGRVPLSVVDQTLSALVPGLRDRQVSLTLELEGRFVPRRFTEPSGWGSGTLTLTGSRGE